jgi:hypothetical protein
MNERSRRALSFNNSFRNARCEEVVATRLLQKLKFTLDFSYVPVSDLYKRGAEQREIALSCQ